MPLESCSTLLRQVKKTKNRDDRTGGGSMPPSCCSGVENGANLFLKCTQSTPPADGPSREESGPECPRQFPVFDT